MSNQHNQNQNQRVQQNFQQEQQQQQAPKTSANNANPQNNQQQYNKQANQNYAQQPPNGNDFPENNAYIITNSTLLNFNKKPQTALTQKPVIQVVKYELLKQVETIPDYLNCPLSNVKSLQDLKVMNSQEQIENNVQMVYLDFVRTNYRQYEQQQLLIRQFDQIKSELDKEMVVGIFNETRKTNIPRAFLKYINQIQFVKLYFVNFMKAELCKCLSKDEQNAIKVEVLDLYIHLDEIKTSLDPKKYQLIVNYQHGLTVIQNDLQQVQNNKNQIQNQDQVQKQCNQMQVEEQQQQNKNKQLQYQQIHYIQELQIVNSQDDIETQIQVCTDYVKNECKAADKQNELIKQFDVILQNINQELLIQIYNESKNLKFGVQVVSDITCTQFVKLHFANFMKKALVQKLFNIIESETEKVNEHIQILNVYIHLEEIKQGLNKKSYQIIINYQILEKQNLVIPSIEDLESKIYNANDIEVEIPNQLKIFVKYQNEIVQCLTELRNKITPKLLVHVYNKYRQTNLKDSTFNSMDVTIVIKKYFFNPMKSLLLEKLQLQNKCNIAPQTYIVDLFCYFDQIGESLSVNKFKTLLSFSEKLKLKIEEYEKQQQKLNKKTEVEIPSKAPDIKDVKWEEDLNQRLDEEDRKQKMQDQLRKKQQEELERQRQENERLAQLKYEKQRNRIKREAEQRKQYEMRIEAEKLKIQQELRKQIQLEITAEQQRIEEQCKLMLNEQQLKLRYEQLEFNIVGWKDVYEQLLNLEVQCNANASKEQVERLYDVVAKYIQDKQLCQIFISLFLNGYQFVSSQQIQCFKKQLSLDYYDGIDENEYYVVSRYALLKNYVIIKGRVQSIPHATFMKSQVRQIISQSELQYSYNTYTQQKCQCLFSVKAQDVVQGNQFTFYNIRKLPGSNQRSNVYLAKNNLNQELILKVQRLNNVETSQNFLREAQLLNIHHRNIIKILDAFVSEQFEEIFGFIVMEKGTTLEMYKQQNVIDSFNFVKEVMKQVTEAVIHLHMQRPTIIHRDIKPDNILIVQSGTAWKAVLTDYDSCNFTLDGKAETGIGTVGYTAVEILQNNFYDYRCDIFSLGKTLLKLLEMFEIQNSDLSCIGQQMSVENPEQRLALEEVWQQVANASKK